MAGSPQRPAPSRKQRAQVNPAAKKLDLFGLVLVILVLLGAIVSILISSQHGQVFADTTAGGATRPETAAYEISAAAVTSATASGRIPGAEVDTVTIAAGKAQGVRKGDLFSAGTVSNAERTLYFVVSEVREGSCTASIHHHIAAGKGDQAMAYTRAALKDIVSGQANVKRVWDEQIVRKAVHGLR